MFHVEHVPRGTKFLVMSKGQKYYGKIIDLFNEEIFNGEIKVENGKISSITKTDFKENSYILPGFVDSHIHIESSMLTPQHFGRIALSHGTVAVVADPHEIANIVGVNGVIYMIENAKGSDLNFFFGAPSCVPATLFESSGAVLNASDIETLIKEQKLLFLSELMNYPGVINNDPEIFRKIEIARKYNIRIDGHAPGLIGDNLQKYIDAGIQTDHECSTLEEAIEKIERGMIIQIREGSAARNFEALWKLLDMFPDRTFLCSDDLHPDDLLEGHINLLLSKAVEKGVNLFNLLRSVTVNPVNHYKLNLGLLRVGDKADFIRVDDLKSFKVSQTFINGRKVFDRADGLNDIPKQKIINNFNTDVITADSLIVQPYSNRIKVITVTDGELLTKYFIGSLKGDKDLSSDISQDILKLVVLNRYEKENPAIAFVHNFNLKRGAIASSIAHDSHNIIAIGVSNEDIAGCINWIISHKGGIAAHTGKEIIGIPLPIAGIISDQSAEIVASKYKDLNQIARSLGCKLNAPFMTLSFLSLLVIPELKLSNKGLFDGNTFSFTSLYEI